MAYHLEWISNLKNHASYEEKDKLPKNWTEISDEEFFKTLYNKTCRYIYQDEPKYDFEGNLLEKQFKIFYFFFNWEEQNGVAIAREFGMSKPKYFKFAECFHTWIQISHKEANEKHGLNVRGQFTHCSHCPKCNRVKCVSSDDCHSYS